MRLNSATITLAATLTVMPLAAGWAQAQTTPPNTAPNAAAAAPATPGAAAGLKPVDPVVARVNGQEVHLSDITAAAQTLPDQYRNMPTNVLYPLLVDQAVDRLSVVAMARRQGLDKDPEVAHAMERAADQTLQNALMARDVAPQVTEAAIRARYDKDIAGKTGEEEVHARHILVPTEAEALKIIAELKKGADFATLAKANSTDPGAAQGGDLGFFKRGDMLPEFAAAAFAMKPGQISDKPVKTQYGWHVIKVEERRNAPAPTFEEAHDELRQQMIQEGVQRVLAQARQGETIERFNPDGTPVRATDNAEPPPAAGSAQPAPAAAPAPAKK
jgi:peptidyl-prolyl cis-trans isomerase C